MHGEKSFRPTTEEGCCSTWACTSSTRRGRCSGPSPTSTARSRRAAGDPTTTCSWRCSTRRGRARTCGPVRWPPRPDPGCACSAPPPGTWPRTSTARRTPCGPVAGPTGRDSGRSHPSVGGGSSAARRGSPFRAPRGAGSEFYRGVVRALRDGVAPPVDPHDAVAVLEVLEAARRSSAEPPRRGAVARRRLPVLGPGRRPPPRHRRERTGSPGALRLRCLTLHTPGPNIRNRISAMDHYPSILLFQP